MELSHYRIEGEIGRGGMGVVYRATDMRLGRAVAIKTLHPEASSHPDRLRRFINEARAASALNHSNIVTIYDIEESGGTSFIAMEFVDGDPLDRLLARGPLPISTALEYAMQVASALEASHASGILHRDIKPANLIVTRAGIVKILDFGVAKLFESAPSTDTRTALLTGPAAVLGTPAYMSPEQADGRPVDARTDIFSLGCVLYEMFTGQRPFAGDSTARAMTAVLRDHPPPLRSRRPDAPRVLQTILDRALAKDPSERYASAASLRADLAAVLRRIGTREPLWRRPAILIPAVIVLLVASAFAAWQGVQARRIRGLRQQVLPEIERLQAGERYVEAFRLARDAERYAPDEIARLRQGWYKPGFVLEPPDADVAIKNYLDVSGDWQPLGHLPLTTMALPFGYYRVRFTKPGYRPLEISSPAPGRQRFRLWMAREGADPEDMLRITGGPFSIGIAAPVTLPDFWIAKHEATNREFQRFVDAGGYRDRRHWKEPFTVDGRDIGFDAAMARFRDATGRPGPAGWELGRFPDGHGDFPVSGISWFEAAAFAEFSGRSLPTIYHWFRAANIDEVSSDILRVSNLDGKGPREVGVGSGLGPFGTVDMAGNVAEWCANGVEGSLLRYILGGSWRDPSYRYLETDGQDPWQRSAQNGVRLVSNLGAAPDAARPIARIMGDPTSVVPAPKASVDVYRRFYDYDHTPLNARADAVDDSSPYWRKERISIDAAYGRERLPLNVFLPRNASPPFQTIVVFPSAYALTARSSELLDYSRFDFIMRSGRAAVYPVYQGTYERQIAGALGPSERRDLYVQMAKDLFRALDYLESRTDIDVRHLGYYSLSMGAYFAPVPLAIDSRLKAAVLASGGLRYTGFPPEVHPTNFAPEVRVPVLLINGKDDFQAPPAAQARLLELLGTPAEQKKAVLLDGGHVPNDFRGLVREALDWFDKYLGPVK
ncbi:MAG TPA: protein kinase [Vicinamibacterales bacterium]|nr:protein kinase [Vicinamibacterales bacterium]